MFLAFDAVVIKIVKNTHSIIKIAAKKGILKSSLSIFSHTSDDAS